jgi:hypothetical protein
VLLKPVCQSCQRRLNELFETPASPILKAMMDGIFRLSGRQQVVLAAWIVKTVLIITMRHPDIDAAPVQRARDRLVALMEDGTPPDDATVRIAHISNAIKQQPREPFLPSGWLLSPHEIGAVFCLPGLLSETFAASRPVIAQFLDATEHDERFIRIWPDPVTGTIWPPGRLLTTADAEALKRAWNRTL